MYKTQKTVTAVGQTLDLYRKHLKTHLLPTSTAAAGVWFSPVFVCLSVSLFIRMISQKPLQLGSPNLTQKCSTISHGNLFILGSKCQRSRSQGTNNSTDVGLCTLVTAGFFQFQSAFNSAYDSHTLKWLRRLIKWCFNLLRPIYVLAWTTQSVLIACVQVTGPSCMRAGVWPLSHSMY